jgi:TolB-like protein
LSEEEAREDLAAHVHDALARMVESEVFARSDRLKELLRYTVEETLAGRGGRLKGYTLGVEVFGRDENFDPQSDTIVRVEMGRLRRKLADYYAGEGRESDLVIEIPKGRYVPRFKPAKTGVGRSPEKPHSHLLASAAILGGLLIVAVAGSLTMGREESHGRAPFADRAIAVLPFTNLTEDPDWTVFGDGLTERIIAGLSLFDDLRVVGRHTSFAYKNQIVDVRDIGRDLGVRFVVEGAVRREGDTIQVAAQLVDARSATLIWSNQYERSLSLESLHDVQESIMAELVGTIGTVQGALTHGELKALRTDGFDGLDAYACTMRMTEYYRALTPNIHAELRTCLETAIEDHPEYLRALSALGLLYLDESRFGYNARPDSLARAETVVRRALSLDPYYQFARSVLAKVLFYQGDLVRFREQAEKALAQNTNNSDVLASLGRLMVYSGDGEEGANLVERAIRINPFYPDWYRFPLLYRHYFDRDYEAALAEAVQIDMPDYWGTHEALALIHGQRGDFERAAAAATTLLTLRPDYAATALRTWRANNLSEEDLANIAEGLTKAGVLVGGG